MKYKTKPCEIEAIQWDATEQTWQKIQAMGLKDWYPGEMGTDSFFIDTLEGKMKVNRGDFIVKGLKGEFYPCKPDIFNMKYEPVSNQ